MRAIRFVRAALVAVGLVAVSAPASAKECGDDIAGARVACACGDTVVASTVLLPTDPIFSARCRGDGLVVRAPAHAETIVLKLNGLSIVGTGAGTGIEVQRGGSEGAAIIGGSNGNRGEIVGFGVGLAVRFPSAIRRIEYVEVEGNRYDGLMLRTAGTVVVDVRAFRNGGDGIRVTGQGGRLIDVESTENGKAGIRLFASELVLRARATGNRRHGIVASGSRNDLRESIANENQGYGVLLGGTTHLTDGMLASGNSLADVGQRTPEVLP